MANREACELYIEQEIRSGLEEGKKPWTIGKELSAWVEKLFEVTINPRTIEKRADRILDSTNVVKKSQPIENIEYSKPEIIEDRRPQGGGQREKAGRKKLIYTETHEVSDAVRFAAMAICQLERIRQDDPKRVAALEMVLKWIENNKGGN